jgi:hypothetical protein
MTRDDLIITYELGFAPTSYPENTEGKILITGRLYIGSRIYICGPKPT